MMNLPILLLLTIIESKGTASLAKDSNDTYWIIDGEQKLQLQNAQGVNYGDNTTPDWDGAAVEANDSGGYEILLQGQNNFSGKAYVWTTNSEGVIIEAVSYTHLTLPTILSV